MGCFMADDRAETASTTAQDDHRADDAKPDSRATMVRRVVLRIAVVVAVLGLSAWVLFNMFDDLDWGRGSLVDR